MLFRSIGIASLYGQGLGAGRTALYRTQAVYLAADMAERIRLNRRGGPDYGGGAVDNGCDPIGGRDCTPAEMAAFDLFGWNNQIAGQLPQGAGLVQRAATTPPTYTISVTWTEVGIGPITHQIAISVPNF